MLRLWALFLQSVFARHPIYEHTKFYRDSTSTTPPVIFSTSFWMRFHNPFWQPSRLLTRNENISYCTLDEKEELKGDAVFLRLDVLQHSAFPRNSPVLIYIHSGLWQKGDKSEKCPLLPYLALKHYVVVSINLRLAPKYNIVDQLVDVKRAIRWTKQNISTFGGDPNFIAICGSSSGGHLATMAAMTANLEQYQPGFKDIDTSLQACISLGAYYDCTRNWGYRFDHQFQLNVIGNGNDDLARQFSPTWRLKEAEVAKTRVTATDDERMGPSFPPFLVIQ